MDSPGTWTRYSDLRLSPAVFRVRRSRPPFTSECGHFGVSLLLRSADARRVRTLGWPGPWSRTTWGLADLSRPWRVDGGGAQVHGGAGAGAVGSRAKVVPWPPKRHASAFYRVCVFRVATTRYYPGRGVTEGPLYQKSAFPSSGRNFGLERYKVPLGLRPHGRVTRLLTTSTQAQGPNEGPQTPRPTR